MVLGVQDPEPGIQWRWAGVSVRVCVCVCEGVYVYSMCITKSNIYR